MSNLVERWNRNYFDGKLSPAVLEFLKDLPSQSAEVQAFVERMFRFMHRAKFRPEDFSLLLGWAVGFMPSRILPGAWGGLIPPITIEGRHVKVDDYLAHNPWKPLHSASTLLDLGCGFPPRTTLDTATRFPDWHITGADPSFGRYIVYDEYGNYACFRADRMLRYFQASGIDVTQWDKLYRDPVETKARFSSLLDDLLSLNPDDESHELNEFEYGKTKLVRNPLKLYERPNLKFVEGGIGTLEHHDFDAIRCFNVLVYFDAKYRENTLSLVAKMLKPGGLFLCGMNWAQSIASKYCVYQKEGDRLALREFAFSLDNLRSLQVVSWFALHDDDFETNHLADAVSVIRSDPDFVDDFDRALDELLVEKGICPRGPDGYLGTVREGMTPFEIQEGLAALEEQMEDKGFVERAAEVLRRAGYRAWRNCVGHVAMEL